jgi:hypothetical protein
MFNFHHERFQRSLRRQLFRILGPSFWLDLCLPAKLALYTFGFSVDVGGIVTAGFVLGEVFPCECLDMFWLLSC